MRRTRSTLALCALAVACGHAAGPRVTFEPPPRLPAPPPSDPQAYGHAYLEQVGVRLQGDWGAFLEDLRLRLPPTDPLNDGRLVVAVDCQVARDGSIGALEVASSGNRTFDNAALEILRDAAPLLPPPPELTSDDDTLHLHWAFARDRRQAGVAGAHVDRVEWPAERAVPKLLDAGDVGEAARRIALAAAHPAPGLDAIAERVFVAAIDDGVASSDVSIRREAAAAIEAAGGRGFAAQARALAGRAVDADVRAHGIAALGALGPDDQTRAVLTEVLAGGTELPRPLVATTARALAAAGGGDAVARAAQAWLARADDPAATGAALAALSAVPVPAAVPAVRALASSRDPIVRGDVCAALAPAAAAPGAWAGIARGLADADATVRAACADAAAAADAAAPATPAPRAAIARIAALLRDRDDRVRAAAARADAAIAGPRAAADLAALPPDRSGSVRAALATAWGRVPGATPAALAGLAGDGDPGVRAAAVAALAARDDADARALAARMAPDPDPRVRLAAVAAIADVDALAGLLTDDDPAVRTAALDRDAILRGRAAALAARAQALAEAPAGTIDRVRIARSWLLAR